MAEASSRDRIARQYVTDFEDVFERGEPALEAALARSDEPKWATLAVYLEFLCAFPDSHIVSQARHRDGERTYAAPRRDIMSECDPPRARPLSSRDLLTWDTLLKERGHQSRNKRGPHGRDLICPPVADHLAVGSQQ